MRLTNRGSATSGQAGIASGGNLLRGASLSLLLSVAWLAPAGQADAQEYRFTAVQINGNERIGDSAILRRAGIGRGQVVSGGQLNDAYQNMQNCGLFETVAI